MPLEDGAEIILAGRAYDPTVLALPVMKGFDTALALHMGKILECPLSFIRPVAVVTASWEP